jgi:diguanylate cyclase (GGDEF)-like protein
MQTRENFSILLVDDDHTIVRVLQHILCDFEPLRFATSGRQALKLARQSVPDLVLLDVDMPGYSGFEVCREFKNDPLLAHVPIIFISSHESHQLETAGLKLGASDFIRKPPHAALVLARVRTIQRLKVLSDTLNRAVEMDILTGTVARRQMEKTLAQECLRAQRTGAPLSLMLVDIDGFTAYNAECGEEMGDACLRSVAAALRTAGHRPTDVLGRYAGGKFTLLLPETNPVGARTVAQRVIDAVDSLKIPQPGSANNCHITVSVGCAIQGTVRPRTQDAGAANREPFEHAVPADFLEAAEHALKGARIAGGHQGSFIDIASLAARRSQDPTVAPLALLSVAMPAERTG